MNLWRIATETRLYAAVDLSGAGAAAHPGRWNDKTEPIVYCAESLALAVLETAAYVDSAGLPLNRFVIQIEVPDDVWAKREDQPVSALPATWDAIPAGRASVSLGSLWLGSLRSPILRVPSANVPEDMTTLINPKHPDASKIKAKAIRRFEYNRLFRS